MTSATAGGGDIPLIPRAAAALAAVGGHILVSSLASSLAFTLEWNVRRALPESSRLLRAAVAMHMCMRVCGCI